MYFMLIFIHVYSYCSFILFFREKVHCKGIKCQNLLKHKGRNKSSITYNIKFMYRCMYTCFIYLYCCLVGRSSISVLSVCQVAGTAGPVCSVLTVTVLLPTAGTAGDQGRTPPDQQRPQNLWVRGLQTQPPNVKGLQTQPPNQSNFRSSLFCLITA